MHAPRSSRLTAVEDLGKPIYTFYRSRLVLMARLATSSAATGGLPVNPTKSF